MIANREDIIKQLATLASSTCESNSYVFYGNSGVGKSTVIDHFISTHPEVHVGRASLGYSWIDAFASLYSRLTASNKLHFPQTEDLLRRTSSLQPILIDKNNTVGSFSVIINQDVGNDRNAITDRMHQHTESLFCDISTLEDNILLIFDDCDVASKDEILWVKDYLQPRIAHMSNLSCAFFGVECNVTKYYSTWCDVIHLKLLDSASHWIHYCHAQGYTFSEIEIKMLCDQHQGSPLNIVTALDAVHNYRSRS